MCGKGKFDGNCNRTACQKPIAGENWFNTSTRAYYCTTCARQINREALRFDGVEILVHVTSPDEQPPFPWQRIREVEAERAARRAGAK